MPPRIAPAGRGRSVVLPARRLLAGLALFGASFLVGTTFEHGSMRGHSAERPSDAVVVAAEPASFARLSFGRQQFGKLEFRGGLSITSSDRRFGGLSSFALSSDGTAIIAVSDEGWWFRASIGYEKGVPVSVGDATIAPLLGTNGRRPRSKANRDAEALTPATPGKIDGVVYVGFESHPHLSVYDLGRSGLDAVPKQIPIPAGLKKGPYNGEFEALGRWPDGPDAGSFIAISESNFDEGGNTRAWIFGAAKPRRFSLARYEDYKVTDLAILPGGDVVTVERSYSSGSFPGMAIRRFSVRGVADGAVVTPEILFAGKQPFYAIDNMEGVAFHRVGGEDRISVLSDDNYNPGQRTLLYQFALKP